MKSMIIRQLAKKAVSLCLLLVVFSTFSMVSLAASSKPVGELLISASAADGSSVTVNGEAAKSGRTLFPNSTISTPEGVEAVVSLGKFGKIQLASGTTFTLGSESGPASGDLTAGQITVLSSEGGLSVKNLAGETLVVNTGESASATSKAAARQTGPGGLEWWKWGLITAAVVTVVVIAVVATRDDSTPVSPIR
jgi:hypothetical protein